MAKATVNMKQLSPSKIAKLQIKTKNDQMLHIFYNIVWCRIQIVYIQCEGKTEAFEVLLIDKQKEKQNSKKVLIKLGLKKTLLSS